jgi:hypothetical protein
MWRIHFSCGLVAFAAVTSVGCRSSTDPSNPRIVIEPIQIDSVELVRNLATPSGLGVHVQGVVGDGCAELLPVRQTREGALITIKIQRQRPEEAICVQIAKLYDAIIPLEGEFPPGPYVVGVNTKEITFAVP